MPFLKRCCGRIIGRPLTLMLASVALLAGCSMVSLGYNRLPDLALWWLNRQLPLTDEQTAQARTDLADWLAWHRRTQLPATADLLRRWQGLVQGEPTADQVCRELDDVRQRLDALTQRALPALAKLAATTTPAQLAELARSQRDSNDDFRQAHTVQARRGWFSTANAAPPTGPRPGTLSPAAGWDKRLATLVDRYGQLYGPLTDDQQALLKEWVSASPFDPARTLAERERRQDELRSVLRTLHRAPPGTDVQAMAETLLQTWARGFSQSPTPGYDAYARALTRNVCEQVAALHRSTSPEQKAHAVRTLQTYERDLRALAQQ